MSVSKQINCIFRYSIKSGQEARFQAYLDKVLPITENEEPYVLEYSLFRQLDGSYLQHERYENEEAVARHLERTSEGQVDFHASTDLIIVMVTGELTMSFWKDFEGPNFINYSHFRQVAR